MCSRKRFQRQITFVLATAICLAGACTKLVSAQATHVAIAALNDQEIVFDIAVVDPARWRQLGIDFKTKPFVPVPHELVASLEANQAFLAKLSHGTTEPGQTFTLTVHDTANPANSERVLLTTEAPSVDPRQPVTGIRYVLTPGRVADGKLPLEVAARMTKSGGAMPPNQLPELSVAEAMTGGRMALDQTHLIALDLQQAQPWAKNAPCLLVTPRRAVDKSVQSTTAVTVASPRQYLLEVQLLDRQRSKNAGIDLEHLRFFKADSELLAKLAAHQATRAKHPEQAIPADQTFYIMVNNEDGVADEARIDVTTTRPSGEDEAHAAKTKLVVNLDNPMAADSVGLDAQLYNTVPTPESRAGTGPTLGGTVTLRSDRLKFGQAYLIYPDLGSIRPELGSDFCLLLTVREKPQNAMNQSQVERMNTAATPRNNTQ